MVMFEQQRRLSEPLRLGRRERPVMAGFLAGVARQAGFRKLRAPRQMSKGGAQVLARMAYRVSAEADFIAATSFGGRLACAFGLASPCSRQQELEAHELARIPKLA